jgi:hypothetical protein
MRGIIRVKMGSAEQADMREADALPPRFRGFRRACAVAGTLLLLLTILRLWWGWEAHRLLVAEVAAIHARGDPISPADFKDEDIPDADNAATYVRRAMAAMGSSLDFFIAHPDTFWTSPPTASELTRLKRAVSNNQIALSLARQIPGHPRAAWHVDFRAGDAGLDLPEYRSTDLGDLLAKAALLQHIQGDDDGCVQTFECLLALSDAVENYVPDLRASMDAKHIQDWAADGVIGTASSLCVASDPASPAQPVLAATRGHVAQLVTRLLDDRELRAGAVRALRGRQMQMSEQSDTNAKMLNWAFDLRARPLDLLLAPADELDSLRAIQRSDAVASGLVQPTLPAAFDTMRPESRRPDNTEPVHLLTHWISRTSVGYGWVTTHFRALTDRRAAAIVLAIRLWRIDHAGNFPATLEELVPAYLPALPMDPMNPNSATFKYKQDARLGMILYSVGEDFRDDGGAMPKRGQYRWDGADAVYLLSAASAPATPASNPSSTKALNNNRDK